MTSEDIWSTMIAARQLSSNYYTISTCLTDILHHYFENSSSSLFNNLSQTLFSSSIDQTKILEDYSNILQNILKQNSLHTNIIQNIRRLFRFDSCLKKLFSTTLDEHCQCHECDCTISNSITDVIHDVDEIRSMLLSEPSQASCACFRCNDKNQVKTLTFKEFSSCLALTVNRLHVNTNDQLTNAQGIVYNLIYIIEFDSTLRSILNVYQRQNTEFVKVDGTDISSRISTIDRQGKFLTLWMSQITNLHNQTDPSQLIPIDDKTISNQTTTSSITFNNLPSIDNTNTLDDDQFWNSLPNRSSPATTISEGTSDDDAVGDLYLTLLHSTNKTNSQIEHNHTVNSLASNILWPAIVNQTQQHNEKTSSSSSSSNSSASCSTIPRNRLFK